MKYTIPIALLLLLAVIIIAPARYECRNGYNRVYISVNKILGDISVTPRHAYDNPLGPSVHDFTKTTSYFEKNDKVIPISDVEINLWSEEISARHYYDTDDDLVNDALNIIALNTYTLAYEYSFYIGYPYTDDPNSMIIRSTCDYNILNSILIY